MATKTSFQRKTRAKTLQIAGTRPSLQNNQLLISTGIPSLDTVLGGGIAVGTVLLIEEDTYGSYSRLMLKYYVAEGIMCSHSILLSGADPDPKDLMTELPAAILDDPLSDKNQQALPLSASTSNTGSESTNETMKIAWRYQNKPQVQTAPGSGASIRFGHYYDLTKVMDEKILNSAALSFYNPLQDEISDNSSTCDTMSPCYFELLQRIKHQITQGQFSTSTPSQQRNILRIGIHSLGSPLWGGSDQDPNKRSLTRFLYALRALMRTTFAVCLITMPTHLFQDITVNRRLQHLCDTVISLDSFVGSDKEKNPAFKEYHGLLNIIKLPRLNSLLCHMPDTLDLAFKLKRKKFMIERLHLPPELSETASRPQEDTVLPKSRMETGCSSFTNTKSKLDF